MSAKQLNRLADVLPRRTFLGMGITLAQMSLAASEVDSVLELQRPNGSSVLQRVHLGEEFIAALWRTPKSQQPSTITEHTSQGKLLRTVDVAGTALDLLPAGRDTYCIISNGASFNQRGVIRFQRIRQGRATEATVQVPVDGDALSFSASAEEVAVISDRSILTQQSWSSPKAVKTPIQGPLDAPVLAGATLTRASIMCFPHGDSWALLDRVRARYAITSSTKSTVRVGMLEHPLIQTELRKHEPEMRASLDALAKTGQNAKMSFPITVVAASVDRAGGLWVLPSPVNGGRVNVFRLDLDQFVVTEDSIIVLSGRSPVVGRRPPIMMSTIGRKVALGYQEGVVVIGRLGV